MDRVEKLQEYARLGIEQYWIVDFPTRGFEIRVLDQTGDTASYRIDESQSAHGEGIVAPTLFPGLVIPLAELWPNEFENPELD